MGRLIVICAVLMFSGVSSNDGLHPNQQGYAVMAPLAQAAIDQSLKRRR